MELEMEPLLGKRPLVELLDLDAAPKSSGRARMARWRRLL
jgi:hypothetical protein